MFLVILQIIVITVSFAMHDQKIALKISHAQIPTVLQPIQRSVVAGV
jgi:hypothetical protein